MRNGKTLAVGAMFLLGVAITTFQQSTATADDPTPWNISKVTKLNRARGAEAGEPTAGPQKYLHIQVQFNVSPAEQKKHNFHVTDARGEEVGELWGWNDARSLVIFEGSWADLNGLYLDANGHREPLFQRARVARPVVATDPEPPRTVQLDPRRPRTYVTPKVRTRVDVPGPDHGLSRHYPRLLQTRCDPPRRRRQACLPRWPGRRPSWRRYEARLRGRAGHGRSSRQRRRREARLRGRRRPG